MFKKIFSAVLKVNNHIAVLAFALVIALITVMLIFSAIEHEVSLAFGVCLITGMAAFIYWTTKVRKRNDETDQ